ncbi:hypothetical protein DFJ73DRAFT_806056 [Zopfochytrium polystomum]|nr:hypothetical protein DFJ73DRAFT_806056 [Zopfochytrium polystomum]
MARFPDCDPTFMRQQIVAHPLDTVNVVTERLLKLEKSSSSSTRNPTPGYPKRLVFDSLSKADLFQSPAYVTGATHKLYADYPDHWKSSIRAVLAECNSHYPTAWFKLQEIKAPTWWLPFGRRPYHYVPEMDTPALVEDIKELDRLKMLRLAAHDAVWEDLRQCDNGHLFCQSCVRSFVEIGLFQTGQVRGKEVACLSGCEAKISQEQVEKSVSRDVFLTYERLLTEKILQVAGMEFVRCPFCQYAEARDLNPLAQLWDQVLDSIEYLRHHLRCLDIPEPALAFALLFSSQVVLASFATSIWLGSFNLVVFLAFGHISGFFDILQDRLESLGWIPPQPRPARITADLRRKKNWPFNCLNCKRASCMHCQKEWQPLHVCYETEKDSLRLFVEQRVSEAFIRICPNCAIQFTKVDGCNKITCPSCSRHMCFVCRGDITKERYNHFCQHFRVIPGSKCSECDKCDLYHTENDEVTRRTVAENARREWIARHPEARQLQLGVIA